MRTIETIGRKKMTLSEEPLQEPLWLAMEKKIAEHASENSSGSNLEALILKIAAELDAAGYKVSNYGGNFLQLRWAMDQKNKNGRPLMQDLNAAIQGLTFEDVANPAVAAAKIKNSLGASWPKMYESGRRPVLLEMVEKTRLGFLVEKAKGMSESEGIRYLITGEIHSDVIIKSLGISQERFDQEIAAIEAEKAEKARVQALFDTVADKPETERIKHLITKNVSDELIIEIAGVDQNVINDVKKSMEEELREKERLAAEEAAKKAAAAAGPALEDISMEDRLNHIEAIRDILDLCDKEEDIRKMCEQSKIPKCLIDIAVSDPDRLDALEKEAEAS
jgi:hypothetical protein